MTKLLLKITFLSVHKSINFDLSSIFNHWFTFSSDSDRYETSCSLKEFSQVNIASTKKYGGEALINSIISWNNIQEYFFI